MKNIEILSLKRNEGDLTSSDGVYEITYRLNDNINSISVLLDSDSGNEITEKVKMLSRNQINSDSLIGLLKTIIEDENASDKLSDTFDSFDEAISSRIKLIAGRELQINGQIINSVLTEHILSMVDEMKKGKTIKNDDWYSLIKFTENLYDNTFAEVREQLYPWLIYQIKNGRLTLTTNGTFLGYKKVGEDYKSLHSGPGMVNGVNQGKNAHLDNSPGNIVEMSRDQVDSNPHVTCSTGLHVGTYDYASGFASGKIVLVEVDPRDVVSVPYDYAGQKIRACRYTVIKEVEDELTDFSMSFNTDTEDEFDVKSTEEKTYSRTATIHSSKTNPSILTTGDEISELTYSNGKTYYNLLVADVFADKILIIDEDGNYKSFKFNKINDIKINS